MRVGLIGLGIMGKPMAENMVRAGVDLLVSDLNRNSVEVVANAGAQPAVNKEIGQSCDVVMTMLPNSSHVKAVMLGDEGLVKYMKEGTVFIDMSSINPVASKEIAAELEKKGISMLDAPVSGGEPKAIDGTLSFMVGGKQEVFNKYKPLLETMGSSVVRCGEVGAGNTAKLANQIVVACNIAAVGEALSFAKKAGTDPELVYQAIRGGLAGSTVMDAKAPMMLSRNFKPGFRIELHIKDLNNALNAAHAISAPVPLTGQLMEMMQCLKADGYEKEDHSSIVKYYEKIANTTVES